MPRIGLLAFAALITAGLGLWVSSALLVSIAIGLAYIAIVFGIRHERAVSIGIGILALMTAKIALLFTTDLSKFIGLDR